MDVRVCTRLPWQAHLDWSISAIEKQVPIDKVDVYGRTALIMLQ